jgi:hypothetical protein
MDGLWRDDPWAVDPAAFPPGDSRARLRFLVTYATLAPSGHNTQPWRFVLHADAALDLRADRRRALPVVDPADRALAIACGAALANIRIAAEALGEAIAVDLLPDPADRDLLARVRALGPHAPFVTGPRLLRAMTARRTSRFAYAPDPVPDTLRDEAIAAAARDGTAQLTWLDDAASRHAVALLVAEGDRIQMADPAFRHELAAWMRSRHGASRDGISAAAFGMPDLLSSASALVVRTFDMGTGQAAHDQALAEGSPVLAILSTPGDTVTDWLAAGEALQRVLLALTAGGFTASFLNQPVEVAALRPRLAAAAAVAGMPQILLRIGRGPKPLPAVRRPVAEVLAEVLAGA